MVEVFKMLNNKYDQDTVPNIIKCNNKTRGNSQKIQTERTKYDRRKFSFCVRTTSIWNSLPEEVIKSLSVNMFKNRLDKFWSTQMFYIIGNPNLLVLESGVLTNVLNNVNTNVF